ncbi:putative oxidoreductase, Fe-dependent alcohol dehydrogenase family [Comamonas testosteroni TK102]|uniref:Putative oxidoreductase, Fe-dependent alcohol dehydrogenase family n=1 Tax=Comamonas testosteroni TK102 TaxID=1392005 RepID=A0A076PPE3_COMTE|nr:hypothetical protein [Comamonas testosteroni]AIJ45545.1 putative oxidoreductase, Fe-dependent alcohol dehydrogenase family [Comamonas testosteroni TK102]
MSTTQACAHVCTVNQKRLIPVTGFVGFANAEAGERRFWVVDTRAPSDIPPPNALQLDDVLLPEASPVSAPRFVPRNNSQLSYLHGGGLACIDRHRMKHELEHCPERTGKWVVLLQRADEAGRIWKRTALCAMDDHGWLVEVPEC